MATKDTLINQLKAIIIFNFLHKFNVLENKIKEIFKKEIKNLENSKLCKLYFYYGGRIGTYIEHDEDAIKLSNIKFNEKETFSQFTFKQIINFSKKDNMLSKILSKKIQSKNREKETFDICSCIIKLISMRNILSHELETLDFNDKSIIEILSNDNINELSYEFLDNYAKNLYDNQMKILLSNYYYLEQILNLFEFEED